MPEWLNPVITIVLAVLGSSGLWAIVHKKTDRKDLTQTMIKGLAHDRLTYLLLKYIGEGEISQNEFENVHKYLYEPYVALGGNGSITRLMKIVEKLPVKPDKINSQNGSNLQPERGQK